MTRATRDWTNSHLAITLTNERDRGNRSPNTNNEGGVTALRTRRRLPVNGAALAHELSGLALSVPSGSGKSTLAAGLMRAGFEFLAHDLVALSAPHGMIVPWPQVEIGQLRQSRSWRMTAPLRAAATAARRWLGH